MSADGEAYGPFEGPEKLLEVWFAPSFDSLPEGSALRNGEQSSESAREALESSPSDLAARNDGNNGVSDTLAQLHVGTNGASGSRPKRRGLRTVPRKVWEDMLDIVKCKVLSVVEGDELDAYLLSESSLFIAPHLLILKTCGTTLNLLGLHRIIEIAREYCGFTNIWRCFYSRKSFFFPERQSGPHKDWRDEVNFLDSVFGTAGSAYTVGPMNRDHWLLYLTSPNTQPLLPSDASLSSSFRLSLPSPGTLPSYQDHTLEILMTHLAPDARAPFLHGSSPSSPSTSALPIPPTTGLPDGHTLGSGISTRLGIDKLFPKHETQLDSYGFDPCGYSANAVIGTGQPASSSTSGPGGGYFTIHVTPEEGWSYASFECNVPLPFAPATASRSSQSSTSSSSMIPKDPTDPSASMATRPNLVQLIQNVVNIFQPGRLSITLFVSTSPSDSSLPLPDGAASETEARAWQSFGTDLLGAEYTRKDRIGYEFDGYDLVFACFEKRGFVEQGSLGSP